MTKVRSISDIAALYEAVRTPKQEVIEEKAQKFPKDTFPQSTKEVKTSSDFENSGPNPALKGKDKKKSKKKKSPKKHGKVIEDNINSFMKSEFDKLFENVMGDDESSFNVSPSMGPEGGEAGEADIDFGGEEEGSEDVTITLSKDLAQQLHDVLMTAMGGDESGGEEGELEDLGIDMESEDGDDMGSGEGDSLNDATEMSELSDSDGQKLMSKGSMKAPGNVTNKTGSKASHTTATDKQGNETKGHPMDLNAGAGGKDQKVAGQSVTNKVGKPFFQ
jgi:hypothetical protein